MAWNSIQADRNSTHSLEPSHPHSQPSPVWADGTTGDLATHEDEIILFWQALSLGGLLPGLPLIAVDKYTHKVL